jgi:integrase
VPHRLIAPFSDPELRCLLALADERERALALVLLDTGLGLSELASLRVGDVRPNGTLLDRPRGDMRMTAVMAVIRAQYCVAVGDTGLQPVTSCLSRPSLATIPRP